MRMLSKNIDKTRSRVQRGFTLIELMVAMAIFLLISAVAFRLFSLQQNSASVLRDQVALNLALRNAVAQLQLDISNAGSGYFQNVNVASWPVGVSIINNFVTTGSSCYDNVKGTYGSNCFDKINVIAAADPAKFPPMNVTDTSGSTGPGNCSDTKNGIAYGVPTTVSGLTLANAAKLFRKNDQLLLLTGNGLKITTVVLTSDAVVEPVVGKSVKLSFNATKEYTVGANKAEGYNDQTYDPLDITTCLGNAPCSLATGDPLANPTDKLTNSFCGTDWIIKLAPITYIVCAGPGSPAPCDQSSSSPDIQDPKLTRLQTVFDSNNVPSTNSSVVMDQIIGFKLGATIYNSAKQTSTDTYQYSSACYSTTPDPTDPCKVGNIDVPYNFSLVRSVRASIIARTPPNWNATYTYRNTFDQGPYQVQGMSVVVSPRNMSMND